MRTPNHVDNRRRLRPADYYALGAFGTDAKAQPAIPPDGDAPSLRIAAVQHRLCCRYRAGGHRPSGAELGRMFGFSRSVWSETLAGRRWAGEAVLTALITLPW